MVLNKYINNVDRLEFTVTNGCTGKCKHCSEGNLLGDKKLDGGKAVNAIKDLASVYDIKSIMTFGGEALLYPDTVCAIHEEAAKFNIPKRQLITNGCFSKNKEQIVEVAKRLDKSGVNDILLSVDCFHVEKLPLEWVYIFAKALCENYNGLFRLQPTWVNNESDNNPYNIKTKECLAYFYEFNIERNDGDSVFPSGNAVKYLSEYFDKKPLDMNFKCGDELYTTSLDNINELMIDCNGDVLACNFTIGNIMENNIIDIIKEYNPYNNPYTKSLLGNGINGLLKEAENNGIIINASDYYSPCEVCRAIIEEVKKTENHK
jgi:MoaA/NifB/PqqE/SkfB family radical SAM enzyme